MKLKKFLLMPVAALCMLACNEKDLKPVADNVAGTYIGTLDMQVGGNSAGTSELTVILTKTSESTVSLSIINKEAPSGGMTISRLEIGEITVTDAGNSVCTLYKPIPEKGFTAVDTGSDNKIVWTFKSFSGSVKEGVLNLDMVAQPGAMPMPITMAFEGSKK